mgnify:CR=1 FL=1
MVNIDTVYQTVLALANKEQRGYITPQEFNLFANHAQTLIFEQYFYDLNQFKRVPGNQSNYADTSSIIEDKLAIFDARVILNSDLTQVQESQFTLPNNFYRLKNIQADYANDEVEYVDIVNSQKTIEVTTAQKANEIIHGGPLVRPTPNRPICYLSSAADGNQTLNVFPGVDTVRLDYTSSPIRAQWGYVVVNEKALWNPNTSNNFTLHESEEKNLINKILKLAGVSIEDPGLVQVATQEEIKNIRQEKA